MDQPDIAPLARRLAEENNVDWRRLRGSGDAGRVVERDVLEYLARVMAGDEALDPTPEPVPEGMQAWPDADVRAGEAQAARDEVELTSTIEDDIFLFDDGSSDDDDDDDAAAPEDSDVETDGVPLWGGAGSFDAEADRGDRPVAVSVDVDMDDLEEDLLVAGDETPETRDDAPSGERDERDERGERADASSVAPSADAGDVAGEPGLPDLFGAGPGRQPDADEPPALFSDDAEEHGAPGAPGAWSSGPELGDEELDEPTWAGGAGMAAVPSIDEPTADAGDADDGDDVPADLDVSLVDAYPRTDEQDDAGVDVGVDGGVDVGVADGAIAPPVAVPSSHDGHAAVGRDVPLLRHQHVWRRQVDLTALVAAQADLAADLGRDDPVPIGAFLLRAGQKALASRGGSVALASIDAGDVRRARVPESSDFAATVTVLERTLAAGESDDASPVDLVVADLSELGIDDAVLQLDAPVLMLGRVLIDNLSGGRRAYLTMSGEGADGADAAQLLARVAEMLESPVRIVV